MKIKKHSVSLGTFITVLLVLLVIVISIILVVVSKANVTVERNTEAHAIDDMVANTDFFVKICTMNPSADALSRVLSSDAFRYKIVFITDSSGHIVYQSELARYTLCTDNLFSHLSGGTYSDGFSEDALRRSLTSQTAGNFLYQEKEKEYLVFQPVGNQGLMLFFMQHQSEVNKTYAESERYIKTIRLLAAAYIIATLGIVFLMGSYLINIRKISEFRLRLSEGRSINAQEKARTYSGITKVLAESYETIYYVNLSDNRYKIFDPVTGEAPLKFEGENFWDTACRDIAERTVKEDRARVENFLKSENLLPVIRSGTFARLRFQMMRDGCGRYYSAKASVTGSGNEEYMIFGIKNVDAIVLQDLNRLAEMEEALRRVEIYRSALLENMIGYLEVNVTDGSISDGPFVAESKEKMREISLEKYHISNKFDHFAELIIDRFFISDNRDYLTFNSCKHLIHEFESGRTIAEIDFSSRWFDGNAHQFRQSYYMTRRADDGKIIALAVLYDMTEKIARDIKIQKLTEELDRSRIKISTGQMQPHFLYNVLGSIREIILEDPQYASDLICDFTTHLRACIKSMSNDSLISFSQEIENIKAYVNIERMRFGDRIKVQYDLRYTDFNVVPLSIQPLVENAIRHGLYPKKDGGTVTLSTYHENGFSHITVEDDGVGFDYAKVKKEIRDSFRDSTGLSNLTLRLEKVMDATVRVESKLGAGTRVVILIPDAKEGDAT